MYPNPSVHTKTQQFNPSHTFQIKSYFSKLAGKLEVLVLFLCVLIFSSVHLPGPTTMRTRLVGTIKFWCVPQIPPMLLPESNRVLVYPSVSTFRSQSFPPIGQAELWATHSPVLASSPVLGYIGNGSPAGILTFRCESRPIITYPICHSPRRGEDVGFAFLVRTIWRKICTMRQGAGSETGILNGAK